MGPVEAFDHAMIERYLKAKDLRYLVDSDGDFEVQFGYDDDMGCSLDVLLIVAGQQKDVYSIVIRSDRRLSREQCDKALIACNQWNRERRWPKACVELPDDRHGHGRIRLSLAIDLEPGCSQALFDDYTDTTIAGAMLFWQWISENRML